MTSFTRKLYARDPAAAEAFSTQCRFEAAQKKARVEVLRLQYGKAVTLACFSPSAHGLRPAPQQECPRCGRLNGHRYPCGGSR